MPDTVRLSVPARGEYAKTVRLSAAALATRAGMDYHAVEDVRLAAEEAFAFACARADGPVPVELVFTVEQGAVDLMVGPVRSAGAADEEALESAQYARFILDAVCDDLEIGDAEGSCFVRLSKRADARAPGA